MKKRILSLLCVLILCLNPIGLAESPGGLPCADCGGTAILSWVTQEGSHVQACPHGVTDESTRAECQPAEKIVYQHDEEHHWLVCAVCQNELGRFDHEVTCTSEGKCKVCKIDCELAPTHALSDAYLNDENNHWKLCTGCNQPFETAAHTPSTAYSTGVDTHWLACTVCEAKTGEAAHAVTCTSEGKCTVCGADSANAPTHTLSDAYASDADNHWKTCSGCTDIFESAAHTPSAEYSSDGSTHWFACTVCQAKTGEAAHTVTCASEGKCTACGADSANAPTHFLSDTYASDADNHWKTCSGCTDTFETAAHTPSEEYSTDGANHWKVCTVCNAKLGETAHTVTCVSNASCTVCGAFAPHLTSHSPSTGYGSNSLYHWTTCSLCNGQIGTNEAHTMSQDYASDGTQHWNYCTACGYIPYTSNHTAACNNKTLCTICGAACENPNLKHDFDQDVYYYDTETHWVLCKICGEKGFTGQHYAICSNPYRCTRCGQPCSSETLHENCEMEWQYKADGHYMYCFGCNTEFFHSQHTLSCANPGICVLCQLECSEGYDSHTNPALNQDATAHWYYCSGCDSTYGYEEHVAYCSSPGQCYQCGAACTAVKHMQNAIWSKDETHHWYQCWCGDHVDEAEHHVSCLSPGVCFTCGKACMAAPTHTLPTTYESDASQHWQTCSDCHAQVGLTLHVVTCLSDGKCTVCGYQTNRKPADCHSPDTSRLYKDDRQHGYYCSVCDNVVNKSQHSIHCDHLGVCETCGIPMEGEPSHTVDWNDYQHDKDNCWLVCSLCHEKVYVAQHYQNCTEPGVCARCGATDADFDEYSIMHNTSDGDIRHDDQYHWQFCTDCQKEVNKFTHYGTCVDKTHCAECGAADVTFAYEPGHAYNDSSRHHDDTYHWQTCINCGQDSEKQRHLASCIDDSKCSICHESGVTLSGEPTHRYLFDDVKSDDSYHWFECADCKLTTEKTVHESACNTPGVCLGCGRSDVSFGDSVIHHYTNEVQSDNTHHWRVCSDCGETFDKYVHSASCKQPGVCATCKRSDVTLIDHIEHNYGGMRYDNTKHWSYCLDCNTAIYESLHIAKCNDPTACCACDATGVEFFYGSSHNYGRIQHDQDSHWWYCTDCGELIDDSPHRASCIDPNKCATCGATGVVFDSEASHNTYGDMQQHDENKHWYVCVDCGETIHENEHYASCIAPGVCAECGAPCDKTPAHNTPEPFQHNDTQHWLYCVDCKQNVFVNDHFATCDNPGECVRCGVAFSGEPKHSYDDTAYVSDESGHWFVCERCSDKVGYAKHVFPAGNFCTDTLACTLCGYTHIGKGHKADVEQMQHDESSHWYVCLNCNEIAAIEAHTLQQGNACTTDLACTYEHCGYVQAAKGHTWGLVSETKADCATDGVKLYRCSNCQGEYSDTTPKLGHSYGSYVSNGDGTHTSTCAACSNTLTNSCSLVKTTIGLITISSCPICGYSKASAAPVVTPPAEDTNKGDGNAEPDPELDPELPEEEAPEIIVTKVETFVIETVDEGVEALPEETEVVIYEQTIIPKAAITAITQAAGQTGGQSAGQTTGQVAPQITKIFTVGATVKGKTVQPKSAVKLHIPCEEKVAEGMRLVLVNEDGTLTELEYEIIDGEIVFKTEVFGVFALLPPEEDA